MFKNNVTVIVAGIIALVLMVFSFNKLATDVKSQIAEEETMEEETDESEIGKFIVLDRHESTDDEESRVYENSYNFAAAMDLYDGNEWIGLVYYDSKNPGVYEVYLNENIIDPNSEEMNEFLYQMIEAVDYPAL